MKGLKTQQIMESVEDNGSDSKTHVLEIPHQESHYILPVTKHMDEDLWEDLKNTQKGPFGRQ
jgi:hypothetical protein